MGKKRAPELAAAAAAVMLALTPANVFADSPLFQMQTAVARKHGGAIEAQSRAGEGTTIAVRLPKPKMRSRQQALRLPGIAKEREEKAMRPP